MRLVSYGADEIDDDDEAMEDEEEENPEEVQQQQQKQSKSDDESPDRPEVRSAHTKVFNSQALPEHFFFCVC